MADTIENVENLLDHSNSTTYSPPVQLLAELLLFLGWEHFCLASAINSILSYLVASKYWSNALIVRQIEFLNHISIDYNEVDCFPAFDDWLPNEILSVIFSVRTKHKASVISIMSSFQIYQQKRTL